MHFKKIGKVVAALAMSTVITATTFATPSIALSKSVNQTAYYGSFYMLVNGIVPNITDPAKQPFIANDRTYVPISALNDLGICKATWVQGKDGALSRVEVLPAQAEDSEKVSALIKNVAELEAKVVAKDNEIESLKKQLKEVKDKKEEEKKKKEEESKVRDYDSRETKDLVSDMQRDINRDRDLNRVRIDRTDYTVDYHLSYRRNFDVEMQILKFDKKDLDKLDRRSIDELERTMEDISDMIFKKFKDTKIYFTIYDKNNNVIGTYDQDYKERLRGDMYRADEVSDRRDDRRDDRR